MLVMVGTTPSTLDVQGTKLAPAPQVMKGALSSTAFCKSAILLRLASVVVAVWIFARMESISGSLRPVTLLLEPLCMVLYRVLLCYGVLQRVRQMGALRTPRDLP